MSVTLDKILCATDGSVHDWTVSVGRLVNWAVITLLELIVTVSGFCEPPASPLQPRKDWLASGIGVRVTVEPVK